MKTSRKPGGSAAESRILAAATQHVRDHGLHRLAIVHLASELGMSHANIYRYFASKEALIDALTTQWLKPLEAQLHIIGDGPDPAYDKLERLLISLHQAYREKLDSDALIFTLFAEAVSTNREATRRHRLRVQSEIQRVVDEGLASGLFAIGDQRRALALVYDVMHRFIHPICLQMDRDTSRPAINARMDRVIKLLLRALQTGRM
ncbi:MAG: TetR/AcrR family transcriptional regulator [Hyphomicrobiales bacterium]|nr:TetR/AcrR family transcriptional regulator [Hyphomicrobiales bacterium]MDE2113900.1 TetR family transcriptional regulator [Hyphomicrobiales bacterium]